MRNEHQRTYLLFYKPFGVLSQFTREAGRASLKDYGPFPRDVYPVGRLDADSEGLLLLTNDNSVKHRLTDPTFNHPRTYLVQVERIPSEEALDRMRKGVIIKGKKTKPAEITLLHREPDVPPRPVPIRFRKNVPTTWLAITIREGRNRQVRKMTAAVGHPTLRLIRSHIANLSIEGLRPGSFRALTPDEVAKLRSYLGLPLSAGKPDKKTPDAHRQRRGLGRLYGIRAKGKLN